jgi:hypothetical protein
MTKAASGVAGTIEEAAAEIGTTATIATRATTTGMTVGIAMTIAGAATTRTTGRRTHRGAH